MKKYTSANIMMPEECVFGFTPTEPYSNPPPTKHFDEIIYYNYIMRRCQLTTALVMLQHTTWKKRNSLNANQFRN